MGKSVGIIGNFSGKLGNAVGFKNSASNDGRTQGVRVYQPVVKNPKSYAQAKQRMRMLPINNTYRMFKDIIDRGQEGVSYGNKSRLAWLKHAMKEQLYVFLPKGSTDTSINATLLTKGTLGGTPVLFSAGSNFYLGDVTQGASIATVKDVSAIIMAKYPSLREGDQLTFIATTDNFQKPVAHVASLVLSLSDTTAVSGFVSAGGALDFTWPDIAAGAYGAHACVLSREGANGAHLRSSSPLVFNDSWCDYYDEQPNAELDAIKSYMTEGSNVDWPQEQISPNLG